MKKLFVFVLIAALVFTGSPMLLLAAGAPGVASDPGQACTDAKDDAIKDVNKVLWLGAGCMLSWIGILMGYYLDPAVPAQRLMGKTSDYVTNYTACYKEKLNSEQGTMAMWGCGGTVILFGVFMAVFFTRYLSAASNSKMLLTGMY